MLFHSEAGPFAPRRPPPIVQPRTVVSTPPLEPAEQPERIHYAAWGARPEREIVKRPSRFLSLAEEAAMTAEERRNLKRPFQKSVWQTWKAIPPRRRQALAIVGLITCYLELYVFHTEDDLDSIRQKPRPKLW